MPLTPSQLKIILLGSDLVSDAQFKTAQAAASEKQVPLVEFLPQSGLISDEHLGQLIANYFHSRFVRLERERIASDVLNIVPESFARAKGLIPISRGEAGVSMATASPDDVVLKSLLEKYLRAQVTFVYATPSDLHNHMFLFRKDPKTEFERILEIRKKGGAKASSSIVELVKIIIDNAYQGGSSDIHVEPEDEYTMIRYRTDGILHDVVKLPISVHEGVITRLKVLSRLATDEHRTSQDGKLTFVNDYGEEVEIRLSIVPTTHNEKAVMRLLSDKSRRYNLEDLGFSPEDLKNFHEAIERPWGMILVTGPTGSGKTTTLYSALKVLNKREVNITTIEDPVEYDIEGVNQIQVNEKTGLTFAKGLRSVVRQDPDVVMVGEIRDKETAGVAVNAAMTGHLVLSTLHTNDAATAFPRLSDMEIEDFLIASTVNVIVAQRLVRKICTKCIHSYVFTDVEKKLMEQNPTVGKYLKEISGKDEFEKIRLFKGKGCQVCHDSGYSGRSGVYEVLMVSDAIRAVVMERKNADVIRTLAMSEGMTTMLHDGLRKVVAGETTLEEILRVTRE
ncbi:Flp pilus assembly complex ATPase component TadA [Candidatus Uhrbacteria bacterium]|jgi:type IV pilus assembly protein PilB|nr:Flp pilus assembly complex ATPase component TadA [Candidatus Uhrbacteria bacterium]